MRSTSIPALLLPATGNAGIRPRLRRFNRWLDAGGRCVDQQALLADSVVATPVSGLGALVGTGTQVCGLGVAKPAQLALHILESRLMCWRGGKVIAFVVGSATRSNRASPGLAAMRATSRALKQPWLMLSIGSARTSSAVALPHCWSSDSTCLYVWTYDTVTFPGSAITFSWRVLPPPAVRQNPQPF